MWTNPQLDWFIQTNIRPGKPFFILIDRTEDSRVEEGGVFCSLCRCMLDILEWTKRVVKLQMSDHFTTSLQVPDPCVMRCWWHRAVFGWSRGDVNVLGRNKGLLVFVFCLNPSERNRQTWYYRCPVLISIFLSVHLILDPQQHLLHSPQLKGEMRQSVSATVSRDTSTIYMFGKCVNRLCSLCVQTNYLHMTAKTTNQ